uniref:ZM domain-containing protein n=1 Tax=Mesocestoides corti TaxID=53468 RepID=A0A5K3FE35_MESCO
KLFECSYNNSATFVVLKKSIGFLFCFRWNAPALVFYSFGIEELSPHTIGHRQGPEGTYNQTMRGKFPAQLSSPSMSPAIFSPNYSYQSHSFPYKPQSPPAEEAPAAPIPSRRHLSSHPQSSSPNIKPLPQRNHSLPLKSSGVAQMPSGRGTAFRKPTDSHRPPSYDSVRAVGMAGKQVKNEMVYYELE